MNKNRKTITKTINRQYHFEDGDTPYDTTYHSPKYTSKRKCIDDAILYSKSHKINVSVYYMDFDGIIGFGGMVGRVYYQDGDTKFEKRRG